jgi:hypothetical protein
MMVFQGTLTDEHGKLAISVFGEWERTSRGGISGWKGWIQNTDPGKGLPVGEHILTLDDGRRGVIRILGIRQSSSSSPVCNFKGNGPPPS